MTEILTQELAFGRYKSGIGTEGSNVRRLIWIDDFPRSLFSNGELGGYYDPTDISSLFQDTAAITPVTADGNPVARINDKSGNGNHLTIASAGFRPLYKTTSSFGQLLFDGVDDRLSFPVNMLLGWTSGTGLAANQIPVDPPALSQGPIFGLFSAAGGELTPFTDGHVYSHFLSTVRKDCGDPGNMAAWNVLDFRSAANSFIAGFNATDFFTTAVNTVGVTTGTAPYPTIGDNGSAGFFLGRIGRIIVINRILTAAELVNARRWIGAGSGVIL